jgi:hypothetical protein
MIPDPSTLTNQYQMMQPPQMDNNKPPSNGLPNLQLPGLPRPPNLPQNDGACDLEAMTTEVNTDLCSIYWIYITNISFVYSK